jgi:hypothetical protein
LIHRHFLLQGIPALQPPTRREKSERKMKYEKATFFDPGSGHDPDPGGSRYGG